MSVAENTSVVIEMARIDTTEFRSNGVDIKEEELQAFTVKLV